MFLEVLLNFIFFPPISYFFQSYFSKSLSEINSIFSKKKIKKYFLVIALPIPPDPPVIKQTFPAKNDILEN